MKILLSIFALLFIRINSSVALINKCCPDGKIVEMDSFEDNNLSRNHFSCVTESQARLNLKKKRESDGYEVKNSSVIISHLIAYNVIMDVNSHWPSCGDKSLSSAPVSEALKGIHSSSCVDVMDNNYHIFSCDESPDSMDDFVDIYKLRKCCAKNHSYDVFNRQCLLNNETSVDDDFREIFMNKVVTFTTGIPECKEDDVLVEYHSHVHKLKIYETSLIITGLPGFGPEVLPESSYCIESTMNSNADLPDGDNLEHHRLKKSSKFVAKVCRNRAICQQMPCIRKCCSEGQRMVYENETYCEDHHLDLKVKFHDFDFKKSQEEPNAIEPSGKLELSNKFQLIPQKENLIYLKKTVEICLAKADKLKP